VEVLAQPTTPKTAGPASDCPGEHANGFGENRLNDN